MITLTLPSPDASGYVHRLVLGKPGSLMTFHTRGSETQNVQAAGLHCWGIAHSVQINTPLNQLCGLQRIQWGLGLQTPVFPKLLAPCSLPWIHGRWVHLQPGPALFRL